MRLIKPFWITHRDDNVERNLPIYSIDCQSSGKRLATGGADAKVHIWSIPPILNERAELGRTASDANQSQSNICPVPRRLATLDGHEGPVNIVRWSHGGRFLASGGDDGILLLWELRPGSTTLSRFGSSSSSGLSQLQSENKDTQTILNDIESWSKAIVFRSGATEISDISWSPCDSFVATAELEGTIAVWDVKSASQQLASSATVYGTFGEDTVNNSAKAPSVVVSRPFRRIEAHEGWVRGVSWDPMGSFIASAGSDNSVSIWRVGDGSFALEQRSSALYEENSAACNFRRMDWSPDGTTLATSNATKNGAFVAPVLGRRGWDIVTTLAGHSRNIGSVRCLGHLLNGSNRTESMSNKSSMTASVCAAGDDRGVISIWLSTSPAAVVVISNLFSSHVTDLAWATDQSGSSQYMFAVSMDGTCSCVHFSENELGKALDEQTLRSHISEIYGNYMPTKLDSWRFNSLLFNGIANVNPKAASYLRTRLDHHRAARAFSGQPSAAATLTDSALEARLTGQSAFESIDTKKSTDIKKPTDTKKSTETKKPTDTKKSTDTKKPTDIEKSTETKKPTETNNTVTPMSTPVIPVNKTTPSTTTKKRIAPQLLNTNSQSSKRTIQPVTSKPNRSGKRARITPTLVTSTPTDVEIRSDTRLITDLGLEKCHPDTRFVISALYTELSDFQDDASCILARLPRIDEVKRNATSSIGTAGNSSMVKLNKSQSISSSQGHSHTSDGNNSSVVTQNALTQLLQGSDVLGNGSHAFGTSRLDAESGSSLMLRLCDAIHMQIFDHRGIPLAISPCILKSVQDMEAQSYAVAIATHQGNLKNSLIQKSCLVKNSKEGYTNSIENKNLLTVPICPKISVFALSMNQTECHTDHTSNPNVAWCLECIRTERQIQHISSIQSIYPFKQIYEDLDTSTEIYTPVSTLHMVETLGGKLAWTSRIKGCISAATILDSSYHRQPSVVIGTNTGSVVCIGSKGNRLCTSMMLGSAVLKFCVTSLSLSKTASAKSTPNMINNYLVGIVTADGFFREWRVQLFTRDACEMVLDIKSGTYDNQQKPNDSVSLRNENKRVEQVNKYPFEQCTWTYVRCVSLQPAIQSHISQSINLCCKETKNTQDIVPVAFLDDVKISASQSIQINLRSQLLRFHHQGEENPQDAINGNLPYPASTIVASFSDSFEWHDQATDKITTITQSIGAWKPSGCAADDFSSIYAEAFTPTPDQFRHQIMQEQMKLKTGGQQESIQLGLTTNENAAKFIASALQSRNIDSTTHFTTQYSNDTLRDLSIVFEELLCSTSLDSVNLPSLVKAYSHVLCALNDISRLTNVCEILTKQSTNTSKLSDDKGVSNIALDILDDSVIDTLSSVSHSSLVYIHDMYKDIVAQLKQRHIESPSMINSKVSSIPAWME